MGGSPRLLVHPSVATDSDCFPGNTPCAVGNNFLPPWFLVVVLFIIAALVLGLTLFFVFVVRGVGATRQAIHAELENEAQAKVGDDPVECLRSNGRAQVGAWVLRVTPAAGGFRGEAHSIGDGSERWIGEIRGRLSEATDDAVAMVDVLRRTTEHRNGV